MPIRWDPLKVQKAMDEVEALVKESEAPLAKAKALAHDALDIPNLPQYLQGRIHRLLGELGRVVGGVSQYSQSPYPSSIQEAITSIRSDLPKDALAAAVKASDQRSLL